MELQKQNPAIITSVYFSDDKNIRTHHLRAQPTLHLFFLFYFLLKTTTKPLLESPPWLCSMNSTHIFKINSYLISIIFYMYVYILFICKCNIEYEKIWYMAHLIFLQSRVERPRPCLSSSPSFPPDLVLQTTSLSSHLIFFIFQLVYE